MFAGGDAQPPLGKEAASKRSIDRWRSEYAANGPKGLLPKWSLSGNRQPRLSPWNLEIATRQISTDRATPVHTLRGKSHDDYVELFEEARLLRGSPEKPITYGAYCRMWNGRKHNVADALGRGGRRLANAVAPHGSVDKQLLLATRPFQCAHIDHCLAPILTESELRPDGQKPWLTILVDSFENEPIAMVLRYEAPSAQADMLVFRDCVRRHGRLPEEIISDSGSDLTGNDMAACLGIHGIHWIKRPTANPRFGSPVERTFGLFLTSVCRGYKGYVPKVENRRAISRSKDPTRLPRGAFDELRDRTEKLLFVDIPRSSKTKRGSTKLERRLEHERVYGLSGVPLTMDLPFLISTSVACKATGTIESAGAVRVDKKRFYSTQLIGRSGSISKFHPRIDPEDESVLYFYMNAAWRVAKARGALANRGRTDASIAGQLHADWQANEPASPLNTLRNEASVPEIAINESINDEIPEECDDKSEGVGFAGEIEETMPWLRTTP